MIELRQVSRTVPSGGRALTILHPIDLTVSAGQRLAIVGPSGSGKSTLLGLMAGLDAPSTGSIIIDGVDITSLTEDALARLRGAKIGFVFQFFHLMPSLTAFENVLVPMELAGKRHAADRARALLAEVGLSDRGHHYPTQLSGGEQQRVALARALANEPPILMADEPTGNLDSVNGRHVMDLLWEVNRARGTTLVLVTHDRELAARRRSADHVEGRPHRPAHRAGARGSVSYPSPQPSPRKRGEWPTEPAMTFVLRMVARETRASWRRLIFFFLCVAIGVGAMAAVRSVIQNVRGALAREARALTAADLVLQSNRPWDENARAIIDRHLAAAGGTATTDLVETATMVRPEDMSKAVAKMVELQAVEPAYPFYGRVVLEGGAPYRHDMLRDRGALVRPELLAQLGSSPATRSSSATRRSRFAA